MRKLFYLKALMLSLCMAVSFVLPLNAQQTDDFFKVDDAFTNRDVAVLAAINLNNETFGAPLGSGLLIMAMAGAGYAVARRKRSLRNGATMLLVLTLMLGMTQCKKNMMTPNNEGNKVYITLNVGDGSRLSVDPTSGEVSFNNGDKIYVGSDGKYVGTLTCSGSTFGGDITDPVEGKPLYFYFLGNILPTETLTPGTTEACSVSISDQASSLPVISMGVSSDGNTIVNYSSSVSSYSATLRNQCALVKFDVTKGDETCVNSNMGVCMTGVNSQVNVSFADNTMTPAPGTEKITFVKRSDNNYWAIMLPNASEQAAASDAVFSGRWKGARPALPEIKANDRLTNNDAGYAIAVTTKFQPNNAASGLFSVSSGKQVRFAKGNLQYNASGSSTDDNGDLVGGTWRFAEKQYDYVGDSHSMNSSTSLVWGTMFNGSTKYTNVSKSPSYNGWIDLFGWGTSGYKHGATKYLPYDVSSTNADGGNYYAYGNSGDNLYSKTGKADWGYRDITDGAFKQWRTLTNSEWNYIFTQRTTTSGHRYVKVIITGVPINNYNLNVYGVLLYPDNWNGTIIASSDVANIKLYNNANAPKITLTEWTNYYEHGGCLFLPMTGYYEKSGTVGGCAATSLYWSSNPTSGAAYVWYVKVDGNDVCQSSTKNRSIGCAVRLVCE